MKYLTSKFFDKQFSKLSPKIKIQCLGKLGIFLNNTYERSLNNHSLGGEYKGYRSINITGDIRIIYKEIDKDVAYLVEIGSHSELYK